MMDLMVPVRTHPCELIKRKISQWVNGVVFRRTPEDDNPYGRREGEALLEGEEGKPYPVHPYSTPLTL